MEDFTKEQVEAMSIDDIVSLLNKQQNTIGIYRTSVDRLEKKILALESKMNAVLAVVNLNIEGC